MKWKCWKVAYVKWRTNAMKIQINEITLLLLYNDLRKYIHIWVMHISSAIRQQGRTAAGGHWRWNDGNGVQIGYTVNKSHVHTNIHMSQLQLSIFKLSKRNKMDCKVHMYMNCICHSEGELCLHSNAYAMKAAMRWLQGYRKYGIR